MAKAQQDSFSIRHPITMHTYTPESGQRVRVQRGDAWGRFTENGVYLEGTIRSADPTFCRWVASGRTLRERQKEPAAKQPAKRKRS